MDKVVTVSGAMVRDVTGLYIDLRKHEFLVKNVGMDKTGTHVYLEESEEKDPSVIVREWLDKPQPPATRKEIRRRKEELDKIPVPQAALRAELVSGNFGDPGGAATDQPPVESNLLSGPVQDGEDAQAPEGQKPGFWKKLKTSLFG